jgi:hypothetical protein
VTTPQAEPASGASSGPDGPRHRLRWVLVAGLAWAAASTLATALAAAVAGHQADLALQPVELALRAGVLLGAPCVGAVLAAVVVPRGGGNPAVVAVGVGVPAGPLLVLRLDRIFEFGAAPALLTVGVLAAWGLVGAALAAGWWARPSRRVERTALPRLAADQPDPPPAASPRPEPSAAGPLEAGGPGTPAAGPPERRR